MWRARIMIVIITKTFPATTSKNETTQHEHDSKHKMQRGAIICVVAVAAACALAVSFVAAASDDSTGVQCLAFSSLTAIQFEPSMTTTRRRTPNQPRMMCVGNCPASVGVTSAQCQQTGLSDNGLPSWKCRGVFFGQLPGDRSIYRLNNVKVSCEGCQRSGDPNVVAGSCVLKYSIEQRMASRRQHASSSYERHYSRHAEPLTVFDWCVIAFVVAGTIACCVAVARQSERRAEERRAAMLDNKFADANGVARPYPVYHDSGYGYGGGGFFNGMMMGTLMSGGFGGHQTTVNNYYDDGGYGGGGGGGGDAGWSDGGGFGGSSSD